MGKSDIPKSVYDVFNTYDISIAKIQLYFRIVTSQINYVDTCDNKVDRRVAGDLPSVASDSFFLKDHTWLSALPGLTQCLTMSLLSWSMITIEKKLRRVLVVVYNATRKVQFVRCFTPSKFLTYFRIQNKKHFTQQKAFYNFLIYLQLIMPIFIPLVKLYQKPDK